MSEEVPFNVELALAKLEGDLETLLELAAVFLDVYESDVANIQSAIARKDANGLQLSSHRFKSSVSNFFALSTSAAALALERIGRENRFEDVDAAWANLRAQLKEFIPALRQFLNRSQN